MFFRSHLDIVEDLYIGITHRPKKPGRANNTTAVKRFRNCLDQVNWSYKHCLSYCVRENNVDELFVKQNYYMVNIEIEIV